MAYANTVSSFIPLLLLHIMLSLSINGCNDQLKNIYAKSFSLCAGAALTILGNFQFVLHGGYSKDTR